MLLYSNPVVVKLVVVFKFHSVEASWYFSHHVRSKNLRSAFSKPQSVAHYVMYVILSLYFLIVHHCRVFFSFRHFKYSPYYTAASSVIGGLNLQRHCI